MVALDKVEVERSAGWVVVEVAACRKAAGRCVERAQTAFVEVVTAEFVEVVIAEVVVAETAVSPGVGSVASLEVAAASIEVGSALHSGLALVALDRWQPVAVAAQMGYLSAGPLEVARM